MTYSLPPARASLYCVSHTHTSRTHTHSNAHTHTQHTPNALPLCLSLLTCTSTYSGFSDSEAENACQMMIPSHALIHCPQPLGVMSLASLCRRAAASSRSPAASVRAYTTSLSRRGGHGHGHGAHAEGAMSPEMEAYEKTVPVFLGGNVRGSLDVLVQGTPRAGCGGTRWGCVGGLIVLPVHAFHSPPPSRLLLGSRFQAVGVVLSPCFPPLPFPCLFRVC